MLDCIRYLMRKGNGEERGENMKAKVGVYNLLTEMNTKKLMKFSTYISHQHIHRFSYY